MSSEPGRSRVTRSRKTAAASPASHPSQSFRRQAPVSCRFCRTRKLRCSRGQPCSNCRSRGITCQPCSQPERSTAPSTDMVITSPSSSNSVQSDTASQILERLRKLEETVASHSRCWDQVLGLTTPIPLKPDTLPILNETPSLAPSSRVLTDQRSFDVVFDTAPLAELATQPSWLSSRPRQARCIWFPLKQEAHVLLSKYLGDFDCLHHIICTSSLQESLNDVYACLEACTPPNPARISLLLAVFMSATFLWTEADHASDLTMTEKETQAQARYWALAVRDVLDFCCWEAASLEVVHALVVIWCIARCCTALGAPSRYLQTAISMARELGLHHCDDSDSPCSSIIQRQIERRTWWTLVSSDWMVAALSNGPDRGLYQLQPRHMIVGLPAHVNDADLQDTNAIRERPLTEPTDMSYLLQRIRLAEISRRLVDLGPRPQPVDLVQINNQLRAFERDMPSFFRMTPKDLSSTYGLDQTAAGHIFTQGHALRSFIQAHYRRVRMPRHAWFNHSDAVAPSNADADARFQRIALHINISLKVGSSCGQIPAHGGEVSDSTENPKLPLSSLRVVDSRRYVDRRFGVDSPGPSDNLQLPGHDIWASSELEWDNLPHFCFF